MTKKPLRSNTHERGFTLAAVMVILSVLMIFVAFTVPQMWSDVIRRERDYQTIWAMKQYARAITEFQRHRKTHPTTLEDLEKQNMPRVLRKLYPNPLSGEVDWIMIPVGADTVNPDGPPPPPPEGVDSTKGGGGPFIGVRPPQTGKSFVTFNERSTYETWSYTITDLQRELNPGGVKEPKKP